MKKIIATAAAVLSVAAFAELSADFSTEIGPVRPEIHSSGFGPTICSQTAQDLEDVKSMGFMFARTHDWALVNSNQRVCDYFHIFPLMHLDAKDPKNYHFGPTDYLLKRTREEAGLDVFFRLGTSIEHSGAKVHFNSLIPEDFDKVAEIFAATVRHYNRGWANGYNWNIKYWEIWNEPEGIQNMWAPPEGEAGKDGNWTSDQRKACRDKFVKFFVIVLKKLKGEFGDEIKVGGPALCGYNTVWLNELLTACREAGVAPDFISWHGYARDPMQYARQAEQGRKLCDSSQRVALLRRELQLDRDAALLRSACQGAHLGGTGQPQRHPQRMLHAVGAREPRAVEDDAGVLLRLPPHGGVGIQGRASEEVQGVLRAQAVRRHRQELLDDLCERVRRHGHALPGEGTRRAHRPARVRLRRRVPSDLRQREGAPQGREGDLHAA